MLFTIKPLSCIDLPISPLESALSLLDIVDEFSFVLTAVGPDQMTEAVHLVLLPHTCVLSTICPCVLAWSMDLVVEPISYVRRSIAPDVAAMTMLLTLTIFAFVH